MDIPKEILQALAKCYGLARMTDDAMDFNRIPLVETKQIATQYIKGKKR